MSLWQLNFNCKISFTHQAANQHNAVACIAGALLAFFRQGVEQKTLSLPPVPFHYYCNRCGQVTLRFIINKGIKLKGEGGFKDFACVALFWRGLLAKLQQLPANHVSDCPFYFYNFSMQYTFTGYRGKRTENIQCSQPSCAKS